MTPARPRLGLVGCGKVGNLHLDRLSREAADVVAVCDPDADALARVAGRLPRRPRLFRSEQDLLAAGLVDAVLLCTPHHLHAPQVRASLDAGVHVLCEKPFVTDTRVGDELVALARARGLALFVSYSLRNRGHVRFLLAAAGRIGPLQRVVITAGERWLPEYERTWRTRGAAAGSGYLFDAGSPLLDLLLRLVASPVVAVDAVLERCGQEVDVRSSLRIVFRSGVRADVVLVGDATENTEHIQLFGERGTAVWWTRAGADPELFLRPLYGQSERGDPNAHDLSSDAAFLAALRSGRGFGPDTARDLYDAATALPVVALTERLYHEAAWK